jgi:uncharacterized protein (DUF488 family)
MNNPDTHLLSVGHSKHPPERFLALLRAASVTAIADVRSAPYSRRQPQYNREELEHTLREAGVAYFFLGDQLGGRPGPLSLYDAEGRVDYLRVRATPTFQQGLDRLCLAAERDRVAMLCSEEDPLDCHRGLMITPALVERDMHPGHVRRDGRIETTAAMEERLLVVTGVGDGLLDGLFATMIPEEERRRLLAEAYQGQARRKAFRLTPDRPSDEEDTGHE